MSEFESDPVLDQPIDAPIESAPWSPSQDEWGQMVQGLNYLLEAQQRQASIYAPPQQEQYVEWDPYDREQVLNLFRQEMAPLYQDREQAQLGEAEERARDILSDLSKRDGEFDIEIARLRAESFLPQMQERYGPGPRAAEEALAAAAAAQRQWEMERDRTAVDRYTNQIATLAGAPGEPGSSYTQGAQTRTMPDYRQGGTVTDRFFGGGDR